MVMTIQALIIWLLSPRKPAAVDGVARPVPLRWQFYLGPYRLHGSAYLRTRQTNKGGCLFHSSLRLSLPTNPRSGRHSHHEGKMLVIVRGVEGSGDRSIGERRARYQEQDGTRRRRSGPATASASGGARERRHHDRSAERVFVGGHQIRN